MKNYNEVLLLKFGEVVLKGLNRSYFESLLIKDTKRRLNRLGKFSYSSVQSVLYVTPVDDEAEMNIDTALVESTKIFGIMNVCKAAVVEKTLESVLEACKVYTADSLRNARTFKVESKRSDKDFPLKSPELSRECGGAILEKFHHLKVDVNNPQVTVKVEIRTDNAYIHTDPLVGAGGMPYGSAGKGLLLLSGGIDSPVAGYMCAKRGVVIDALHFESFPYTSERAREKVVELASAMEDYCGKIKLTVASVTEIQEHIKSKCNEDYFTLLLRRFMMRIAEEIALQRECRCLITGESLGQVASQTMNALNSTNSVVKSLCVHRPLIAMDKEDIVKLSRKIGTFDISIQPFEDCCTVFTPRHPVTNPKLENILAEEAKLDVETLVKNAVESAYIQEVNSL